MKKFISIFFLLFLGLLILAVYSVQAGPDYVVITTSDYDDAFQNLTNWKEIRGLYTDRANLTTHIELLSNITSNSSFWDNGYWDCSESNDTQSQIRNYINYTYQNHSTQYVLLGGYPTIIPARIRVGATGNYHECDLYYANIDEDISVLWNDTWIFEVSIGRIPFLNVGELDTWISRQKIYENTTDEDWARSVIAKSIHGFSRNIEKLGWYQTLLSKLQYYKFYSRDRSLTTDNTNFTSDITSQFMVYSGHGDYGNIGLGYVGKWAPYGYNNLTYPYINIGCGCSQGAYHTSAAWRQLLFSGGGLEVNRTAIAHLAAASDVATEWGHRYGVFLNETLTPTSTSLGTSFGTAFNEFASSGRFFDLNLFGCPEVKPYLSTSNVSATIYSNTSFNMYWMYGDNEFSGSYPLSYHLTNSTITGTAKGSNFSNYTLSLGYYNNYEYVISSRNIGGDPPYYKPIYDTRPTSVINTNTTPDGWRTDCFDITDPSSTIDNSTIGTINFSKLVWLPKGVYIIRLSVNDSDGNQLHFNKYFSGFGYLEGVAYYPGNNTEVPVGTDVNITFMNNSHLNETRTVQTFSHDGHTGYYNFSFWNISIQPSEAERSTPFWPLYTNNITAECKGISETEVYYLGGPEGYMTLNINDLQPEITDETPTHLSMNVSISTSQVSVLINDTDSTFNWTIEGSFLTNNNSNGDTNGTKTANIGSLNWSTLYTWYVNVTDGTNILNETYIFTTIANSPPNITNPNPSNGTIDQELAFDWNVTVQDTEGDLMNITIECPGGCITQNWNNVANNSFLASLSGMSYNTNYTVYVNASDGLDSTNATYWFITKANQLPVFSDYWPANESTGITFDPVIYGSISDPDGDTLNGYFRTNASGAWQNMGSFGLVGNCSINCNTGVHDVFQTLSTKYWWSMNLSDGTDWVNTTYTFTTRGNTLPVISDISPANKTIGWSISNTTLSFTLSDANGDYMPFNTTTNISATFNQSTLWKLNGTYYLELSSLEPETNYTWWINVTDYHHPASTGFIFGYTNETFWFVTGAAPPPLSALDGMSLAATALFIAMVAFGSVAVIVALVGKWKM